MPPPMNAISGLRICASYPVESEGIEGIFATPPFSQDNVRQLTMIFNYTSRYENTHLYRKQVFRVKEMRAHSPFHQIKFDGSKCN